MNHDTIKSFIYLDDYKLYSLSSQLFKGFTEYIISGTSTDHFEGEAQKGSFASGKVMGDILSQHVNSSEKKFLHDYAFNLLEKELIERKLIYTISKSDTLDVVKSKGIIKVTGNALINDYKIITNTLSKFNSIGESIGHLTITDQLMSTSTNFGINDSQNCMSNISKKNKEKINKELSKALQEQGLHIPEPIIKHLLNILEYGFHGELEFRILSPSLPFQVTSILTRDYLRDQESRFISKYSRNTEFDFTLIGIITQASDREVDNPSQNQIPSNMKELCIYFGEHIAVLENIFRGKMESECIVDPIAIYRTL